MRVLYRTYIGFAERRKCHICSHPPVPASARLELLTNLLLLQ